MGGHRVCTTGLSNRLCPRRRSYGTITMRPVPVPCGEGQCRYAAVLHGRERAEHASR